MNQHNRHYAQNQNTDIDGKDIYIKQIFITCEFARLHLTPKIMGLVSHSD